MGRSSQSVLEHCRKIKTKRGVDRPLDTTPSPQDMLNFRVWHCWLCRGGIPVSESRVEHSQERNSIRCYGPRHFAQIDLRTSVWRTSAENASTRIHFGVSDDARNTPALSRSGTEPTAGRWLEWRRQPVRSVGQQLSRWAFSLGAFSSDGRGQLGDTPLQ